MPSTWLCYCLRLCVTGSRTLHLMVVYALNRDLSSWNQTMNTYLPRTRIWDLIWKKSGLLKPNWPLCGDSNMKPLYGSKQPSIAKTALLFQSNKAQYLPKKDTCDHLFFLLCILINNKKLMDTDLDHRKEQFDTCKCHYSVKKHWNVFPSVNC